MQALLTIKQVLKRYSITEPTLWLWRKQGKFPPAIMLGGTLPRWRVEVLDRWEADGCPQMGSASKAPDLEVALEQLAGVQEERDLRDEEREVQNKRRAVADAAAAAAKKEFKRLRAAQDAAFEVMRERAIRARKAFEAGQLGENLFKLYRKAGDAHDRHVSESDFMAGHDEQQVAELRRLMMWPYADDDKPPPAGGKQ